MINNPINFNDPTGHTYCGQGVHCGFGELNGGSTLPRTRTTTYCGQGVYCGPGGADLEEEFAEFPGIPQYTEEEMVDIPWGEDSTEVTPAELALLGMEDGNDDKTMLYYRMAYLTNDVRKLAFYLFPDQSGNNSPRNAFQHAFWSALLVHEFGMDYATSFAYAHEQTVDEERGSQFMDEYNNEVGRQIALNNPDAEFTVLAALVLEALSAGDLVVWDGQNIYYSDACDYIELHC